MVHQSPTLPSRSTRLIPDRLIPFAAALALAALFWWPLVTGGGFIGGDLYSYFFPQKTFYADSLDAGQFPLWNNRTGHGYPLLAESQTGALYPANLVLYRLFDVNSAYHLSHLLHYVAAFLFTWLYARRLDLKPVAALFAALVYTYSWFPPRSCLEWAIIGGAWFPLALWCVESFLQRPRTRYLILLGVALAIHLLAGHYNLAFITTLTIVGYVPLRLWLMPSRDLTTSPPARNRARSAATILAALALGFALAAVQLLPTLELKARSQRETAGRSFDPGYGHIPPLYWSQIVAPWLWYAPDIDTDRALNGLSAFAIPSATNKVEAHLYFGLVPIALALGGLLIARRQQQRLDRRLLIWIALGLAAFLYTSGWLLPVTRHLPGFGFFMGPGRYGIVTTLAVALVAGTMLDRLRAALSPRIALLIVAAAFALTTADLWLVSRLVTYTVMLDNPPIANRHESIVQSLLDKAEQTTHQPARLFAPGPNLPTLVGAAATPPYLGLGPEEYFDPALTMPAPDPKAESPITSEEQIVWLQRAGVTHVLSFQPLDTTRWPLAPVWQGFDPLLNPAWARFQEPLYLYELNGTRGRAAFENSDDANRRPRITAYRANEVVIETNAPAAGRLILTDLFYPGWTVAIDGRPAQPLRYEDLYRAVDVPPGPHRIVWTYRPRSVYWGAGASLTALLLLIALARFAPRQTSLAI